MKTNILELFSPSGRFFGSYVGVGAYVSLFYRDDNGKMQYELDHCPAFNVIGKGLVGYACGQFVELYDDIIERYDCNRRKRGRHSGSHNKQHVYQNTNNFNDEIPF